MPDLNEDLARQLSEVNVPRETPKTYKLPWKAEPGEAQEVDWCDSEEETIQLEIAAIQSKGDPRGPAIAVAICGLPIAICLWKEPLFLWLLILPFPVIPAGVFATRELIRSIACFPGISPKARERLEILEKQLPGARTRDEDRERRYQERLSSAREEQKRRLQELSHWLEMDGHTFEGEFAALLRRHDWSVWVTKASGDGGIDIQGSDESGTSVAIQCKRWKKKAGSPEVRDLRGAAYGKFERLIVVCSGGFSKDALAFGEENTIELWGAEQIEIMLREKPSVPKEQSSDQHKSVTYNSVTASVNLDPPKASLRDKPFSPSQDHYLEAGEPKLGVEPGAKTNAKTQVAATAIARQQANREAKANRKRRRVRKRRRK